tara:strand:- start:564 stop:1004 length:441 start_codon:yes stop_codon:yes gene_type:complete
LSNGKYKVGITAGAMDLLHAGHVLMLKEAKYYCKHLIVLLHTDPSIDRPEKNKPIQTLKERIIQLEGCKYVDEISLYDTEKDLKRKLKKYYNLFGNDAVRIIGKDWEGKKFTGHDLPLKCIFNSRNHNYSSSELRERIFNFESCKK